MTFQVQPNIKNNNNNKISKHSIFNFTRQAYKLKKMSITSSNLLLLCAIVFRSVTAYCGFCLDCEDAVKLDTGCNNDIINTQCKNICKKEVKGDDQVDDCDTSYGFFKVPFSSACYKIFHDQKRTWELAGEHCRSNNLILAEEPWNAARLRKYIVDNYGSYEWHWLGARGNGISYVWWQSRGIISKYSRFWLDTQGQYSHKCLLLATVTDKLNSHPLQPYYHEDCKTPKYTLCEVMK